MTVFRGRCCVGALLVVVLAAAGGCQSRPAEPGPTPSASRSASPSASPTRELTAEEDLANNPPAPLNVQATVVDGRVNLMWQPPPPVRIPHRYSDRVVSYRIYRRAPGEVELRPVGTSTGLTYTDSSVAAKGEYAYAVTSIRDPDVEGSKSDRAVMVRLT